MSYEVGLREFASRNGRSKLLPERAYYASLDANRLAAVDTL